MYKEVEQVPTPANTSLFLIFMSSQAGAHHYERAELLRKRSLGPLRPPASDSPPRFEVDCCTMRASGF